MSAQLKDLTRLSQPSPARSGMVKISYGVHNLEAAIAGKSVSEVRQSLKEPLNIDPRALALVNGRDVAASYILNQGDQLEFVRLAGEKGGDRPGASLTLTGSRVLSLPSQRRRPITGYARFSPRFLTCLPKKGKISKCKESFCLSTFTQ
jgi:hypothetical protein